MALQVDMGETPAGASLAAAYVRVNEVLVNSLQKRADINVGVFLDAAARSAGKAPVEQRSYRVVNSVDADGVEHNDYDNLFDVGTLDGASSNPFGQAYAHIKTLDEYAGALDV